MPDRLLARVGGQPVGMASVFEDRRMPRPGRPDSRWGYLSTMFVREEFRKSGIGSALLAAIITAVQLRQSCEADECIGDGSRRAQPSRSCGGASRRCEP